VKIDVDSDWAVVDNRVTSERAGGPVRPGKAAWAACIRRPAQLRGGRRGARRWRRPAAAGGGGAGHAHRCVSAPHNPPQHPLNPPQPPPPPPPANWRFQGIVKGLPWRPLLAAAGSTTHVIDPATGLVVEHIERWKANPGEVGGPWFSGRRWAQACGGGGPRRAAALGAAAGRAPARAPALTACAHAAPTLPKPRAPRRAQVVARLLRPARTPPGTAWETFMLALSAGDAAGMWFVLSPRTLPLSGLAAAAALVSRVATGHGLPGAAGTAVEVAAAVLLPAALVTEVIKFSGGLQVSGGGPEGWLGALGGSLGPGARGAACQRAGRRALSPRCR
jgi:hypothetical protein